MNQYGIESGSNIIEMSTTLWDNELGFTNNYLLELDNSFAAQGNLTGIAEVDFLQTGFVSNSHTMPMCFVNNNLVIALYSQVKIYSTQL